MRICFITSLNFPPEEGIGNYLYNLSSQFLSNGHDVTIITRGNNKKVTSETLDGITIYRVPFYPVYPFHVHLHGFFVRKLLKSLEDSFDIVHYHSPLPPAIDTKIPTVLTIHTPMKTDTRKVELVDLKALSIRLQGFVSQLVENKLISISDKITSVSTSVSSELSEYGLDKDMIEVVGNGVDENLFCPAQKETDEKYILYTGRLSYRKGLFDFINCGIQLCSVDPDLKIKIVGKGPLESKLNQIVNDSVYADRFEFLGYVEKKKLIELYQNATVFVLPSHYEGLPTTLLEAMACGLPVVATEVSGNLDVIEDGMNGIFIPVKSPEKMAEAVLMLLNDQIMQERLSLSARKTIEERFTWEQIAMKIFGLYTSTIEQKKKNIS